jgi:uncharacterized repeat protein (TIGR03803 family)
MKPRNFILIALLQTVCLLPAYSKVYTPLITMGKLTVLNTFSAAKGANSYGGLLSGNDGNFYGTTATGGKYGSGTVFKLAPDGTLTTLNSFSKTNGAAPYGGLAYGIDGNFYGTTSAGGTNNKGTVFKMTPAGAITTLWSFNGKSGGATPYGGVVQGADGYFYGTTVSGGTKNKGTVFKLSPTGSMTTLYFFSGADGANPHSGLVLGTDGTFYGTTSGGGDYGKGTVFNIDSNGTLSTLWSFSGTKPDLDGENPYSGLVEGSDGNFYGTTVAGGEFGKGTAYQVSPWGSVTILWSFSGADGASPYAPLQEGSEGIFYGTTTAGGANGKGTVFTVTSDSELFPVFSFSGKADGANPYTGLTLGEDGSYYGTTLHGGTSNAGTLFKQTFTTGVTAVQATLLASVNPMGVPATYFYEYGTDTSYGDQTDQQTLGLGKTPVDVSTTLDGLDPSTTYHYHLVVSTDVDTYYSSDQTFTTGAFGLEMVLAKNDPARGMPGAIYSSSGIPALNNNLGVAFQAVVTGTGLSGNSGIWADELDVSGSNIVRQLVVTIGSNAPGTPFALFAALGDPVYNNNNSVAFWATLKIGTGDVVTTPVNNSVGIWSNEGGTLHLVARQGDSAPGCTTGELFASFSQFVLPDQGGVVLLGNLTSGLAASWNNQGIWAVDMTGQLTLIVRKGDTLFGKTIKTLTFLASPTMETGQTRGFSQNSGDILYSVTFTDGSWGIYKVALP